MEGEIKLSGNEGALQTVNPSANANRDTEHQEAKINVNSKKGSNCVGCKAFPRPNAGQREGGLGEGEGSLRSSQIPTLFIAHFSIIFSVCVCICSYLIKFNWFKCTPGEASVSLHH